MDFVTKPAKEHDCTYCIHREVCGKKEMYLDMFKKLPECPSEFQINVSCQYCRTESQYRPRNSSVDELLKGGM